MLTQDRLGLPYHSKYNLFSYTNIFEKKKSHINI